MSSTLLENIKKTESFFASYDTLNADEILEHWADNCFHKIRPDSLGRQKRNQEEYRAYVNSMAWVMKEFKVSLPELIPPAFTHSFISSTLPTATP